MTSYAERLATELRNAYEAHDRDAFERATRRMVSTMHYTGPVEAQTRPIECARTLHACECTTPQQRSHCMFRATA